MIGYARCPKCHAPMPGSGRLRPTLSAGGTTVERVELGPGDGGRGWLWVAGMVLVGLAVVVWATVLRGGDGPARSPAAAAPLDVGPEDDRPLGGGPVVEDDEPVAPRGPTGADPAFAADTIESELAGERLYATVTVVRGRLEIRSAFCAEGRLGDIVARHAGELRAAGVSEVHCREVHGALVFERGL